MCHKDIHLAIVQIIAGYHIGPHYLSYLPPFSFHRCREGNREEWRGFGDGTLSAGFMSVLSSVEEPGVAVVAVST